MKSYFETLGKVGIVHNATCARSNSCSTVMSDNNRQSLIEEIGCKVSTVVSDLFANPVAQIAVILFCAAWFALGFRADLLTAALSILAITLTQMVLNRQNQREVDAHRRDIALHAKLDELILAKRGARDSMAGIEELEEEEIIALRENSEERIEDLDEVLEDRHSKKGQGRR